MTKDEVMQMAIDVLEICNGAETVEGIIVYTDQEIEALRTALAQPDEQIGITYEEANPPQLHCTRCGKKLGTEVTDIHTCTPIKKEWVGLTDEEIDEALDVYNSFGGLLDARKIEAKLKEKNSD